MSNQQINIFGTLISSNNINEIDKFYLETFIEKHIENVKQLISCPICWDIISSTKITQHLQCSHILCNDCDENIMKLQKKCPICRKCWICATPTCICNHSESDSETESETYTDNDPEIEHINYFEFDSEIDDYVIIPGDNLEIPSFQGTNETPITNLFPGRRWFNVDMKQVSYYLEGNWLDEIVYMNNPLHYTAESMLAIKLITGINKEETFGFDSNLNCKICGIQRTREVNTYIINDIRFVKFYYRTNTFVDGNLHTDNYCWGTNVFDGNGIDYCFNCYCVRDSMLKSIPTY
jgi:hypothetical protein